MKAKCHGAIFLGRIPLAFFVNTGFLETFSRRRVEHGIAIMVTNGV
jgi:hypothetical protein